MGSERKHCVGERQLTKLCVCVSKVFARRYFVGEVCILQGEVNTYIYVE